MLSFPFNYQLFHIPSIILIVLTSNAILIPPLEAASDVSSKTNSNEIEVSFQSNSPFVIYDIGARINQLLVWGDHLLIGARNHIIRTSFNFTHEDGVEKFTNFSIGPIQDHEKCLPFPENCEFVRKTSDIDVVNFFILIKGTKPFLIACTNTQQGMCYVFDPINFGKYKILGSPNKTQNFLASRTSSYTVPYYFTPSSDSKMTTNVLVVNSYDKRPVKMSPPEVSIREMARDGWTYITDRKDEAKIYLLDKYKTNFPINYLYGFNDSSFVYVLKVEPKHASGTEKVTKLIRVCPLDVTLTSYSEISLECSGHTEATTAYLGEEESSPSKSFTNDEQISHKSLFISYRYDRDDMKSIICSFPLTALNKHFGDAVRACNYRSNTATNYKVNIFTEKPCEQANTDNPCLSTLNPYIQHPTPFSGSSVLQSPELITSLRTLHIDYDKSAQSTKKGFLIIFGTENGYIQRATRGEIVFSKKFSSSSILPSPVISPDGSNLIFASSSKLINVPLKSCLIHSDCGSCLLSSKNHDPLYCYWDGTSCNTSFDSSSRKGSRSCPPKIYDFEPKSGPLAGGTTITLKGKDLGVFEESLNFSYNLTVAGIICDPLKWKKDEIICKTENVSTPLSGPIRLKVLDVSVNHPYEIDGSTESSAVFSYKKPVINDVKPKFSPLSGNSKISITGLNLDIGSDFRIYLDDVKCNNVSVHEGGEVVTCFAGAKPLADSSNIKPGQILVQIDDEKLTLDSKFEYRPDPKPISVSPETVTASVSITQAVTGEHFDSFHDPRVKVSFPLHPHLPPLTGNCKVLNSTIMHCSSPILEPPYRSTKTHFEARYVFISAGGEQNPMDPLTVTYLPDPKFSQKIEVNGLTEGSPTLTIYGENLSSKYISRVFLIKAKENQTLSCHNLRSIGDTTMICDLLLDSSAGDPRGSEWQVEMRYGGKKFTVGKVSLAKKSSRGPLIATLIFVSAAVIAIISLVFIIRKRRYSHKKKGATPAVSFNHNGYTNDANDYIRNDQRFSNQPLIQHSDFVLTEEKRDDLITDELLFNRDDLELVKEIGEGNFGIVFEGRLTTHMMNSPVKVAVKRLKPPRVGYLTQEIGDQFLEEGLLMKDFDHKNVISLIGIVFDHDGWPLIVTPYMSNGNLWSYIVDEEKQLTLYNLIKFGIDICEGMCYLAKLKFVHRDLAARNCLLDENLCVKVSDFGLARDVYTRAYYSQDMKVGKSLPRKWMAPESLEHGIFSHKTDVWSFGVTLWELVTRGDPPYADLNEWDLRMYLKSGRRLQKPEVCPEEIYTTMERCWIENPEFRPTFDQILTDLRDSIAKSEELYAERKMTRFVEYVNCPPEFANPSYDLPKGVSAAPSNGDTTIRVNES